MYEIIHNTLTGKTVGVLKDSTTFIPLDEKNKDYRDFLDWNSKQDEPLDLSDQDPKPLDYVAKRTGPEGYKSFGDQLDMIFHDRIDGTKNWNDHINDVKNRFPK